MRQRDKPVLLDTLFLTRVCLLWTKIYPSNKANKALVFCHACESWLEAVANGHILACGIFEDDIEYWNDPSGDDPEPLVSIGTKLVSVTIKDKVRLRCRECGVVTAWHRGR